MYRVCTKMTGILQSHYFDTEKFISEIEKRQPLYDGEVHPHSTKQRLWVEVAQAMVSNWDDLSERDQEDKMYILLKKWRNIKDCLRKEIKQERHPKPGAQNPRRRKYLFYNQLRFLVPFLQNIKSQDASSSQNKETNDVENGDDDDEDQTSPPSSKKSTSLKRRRSPQKENSPVIETWPHYKLATAIETETTSGSLNGHRNTSPMLPTRVEERQPARVEERREDDLDEDKLFLLSLVPSFKKLTSSEKLMVKVQFLQVLQNLSDPLS